MVWIEITETIDIVRQYSHLLPKKTAENIGENQQYEDLNSLITK